jgi:hypothetical protein
VDNSSRDGRPSARAVPTSVSLLQGRWLHVPRMETSVVSSIRASFETLCFSHFDHSAPTGGSTTSGLSQKRSAQKTLRPSYFCPKGFRSCPVYGQGYKRSFVKSYECVDTSNSLESCGGCVHSDSLHGEVNMDGGRDCSTIPNVDSVRCKEGRCLIGQPSFWSPWPLSLANSFLVELCVSGYTVSLDGTRCIHTFD